MSSANREITVLVGCALGCAAISWLRYCQVGTLRIDDVPLPIIQKLWPTFAFGALVAIMAWRFFELYRCPGTLGVMVVGAVALHLSAALALPLTSNDLFSNLAYGHLAAMGYNPYLTPPRSLAPSDPFAALVGRRWLDTPVVYGPIVTGLCAVVGRCQRVWSAIVLWKATMLAIDLATVYIAYRVCRDQLDCKRSIKSFVLFAYSPVAVWEIAGQAHNDGVLVLAMIGFVWAAYRDRQWLAVLCLTVALYAKLAAVAILILYLVLVFRGHRTRAIAMTLLVATIGVVAMRPYWHGIASMGGPIATLGGQVSRTSRSFADLAVGAAVPFGKVAQTIVYRVFWLGGASWLILLLVRAAMQVKTVQAVMHYGSVVFCGYCLVAAPWFQPWYVTWLLPLALAHHDSRWQQNTALYAALTPVQYFLQADPITTILINIVVIRKFVAMRQMGNK
jgi:hypothetical protein